MEPTNQESTTETQSCKGGVSGSLLKVDLINELDRRIKWFSEMAKANKGQMRKSYEDSCTSFVIFKMWVQKQTDL